MGQNTAMSVSCALPRGSSVFPASSPLCPGASSLSGGLSICCRSKTGFHFMQFLFFSAGLMLLGEALPGEALLAALSSATWEPWSLPEARFLGETRPHCREPPGTVLSHPSQAKRWWHVSELSHSTSPRIVLLGTEHLQARVASCAVLMDVVGSLLPTTWRKCSPFCLGLKLGEASPQQDFRAIQAGILSSRRIMSVQTPPVLLAGYGWFQLIPALQCWVQGPAASPQRQLPSQRAAIACLALFSLILPSSHLQLLPWKL